MELQVLHGKFSELVTDIGRNFQAIAGKEPNEVLYKGLILYFFAKGWKSYQSMYFLCMRKFAEDAGILTRSLFEMTVTLLYISKSVSERVRLFYEYECVQKKQLHDTLSKNAEDPWCKRILASKSQTDLEAELKEYDRVKNRYPKKWLWSGKSIKEMAEEVGLSWHYDYIYFVLSSLAHTSPGAVKKYLSPDEGGVLLFQDSSQEDIDRIYRTACIYFLIILDKVNDAFELSLDHSIRSLDRDLKPTPSSKVMLPGA